MARIAGIELQENWRLPYALTHLKGIGWPLAMKILKATKINENKRVSDLSNDEINRIASELEKHKIEGELVKEVRENIQRLQTIGTYRGARHRKGLPVRGQRTRSNARQKRGKRRTVGAYRKEALAKMKQTTTAKTGEK